jgi:hypothetical protein
VLEYYPEPFSHGAREKSASFPLGEMIEERRACPFEFWGFSLG